MPYPNSPFPDDFDIKNLIISGDCDDSTVTEFEMEEFRKILKWLCETPKITYFRVNSLHHFREDALFYLRHKLIENQQSDYYKLEFHPTMLDVIKLYKINDDLDELKRFPEEVIVDSKCGASILRGAHLYAPGVLAMTSNVQNGDYVSVYADIAKKCKKGLKKLYTESKVFLGNGMVLMNRKDLFSENPSISGIAVKMIKTISNCPSIGDNWPKGLGLLQNLSSIVCVEVLDPRQDDLILDMCAAPGNKTTVIAAKTKCQGFLCAIEKNLSRAKQLKQTCIDFGLDNYKVFQADSTKLLEGSGIKECIFKENTFEFVENNSLPFQKFNKILLDAPCSGLGQRPQLLNTTSLKVIKSYVPLQRRLFRSAVDLLEVDGILVYSTCTITIAENEGIVSWALKTFDNLELVDANPRYGGYGFQQHFTNFDHTKLQRFGPESEDTIGFFIAKFRRRF